MKERVNDIEATRSQEDVRETAALGDAVDSNSEN